MRVHDFDAILDKIKRKYDLFFFETEINNINLRYDEIEYLIIKLFEDVLHGSKIAMRSGGTSTKEILDIISTSSQEIKKYIVCIIDQYSEEKFIQGIPVVRIDAIDEKDIDIILVTSFTYRAEMKYELERLGKNIEVLDIYDYLADRGLFFDGEFYKKIDPRMFYLLINYYKKLYMSGIDDNELYLRKLISCYLSIRDFVNAFRYIDEYCSKYTEWYDSLKKEIYELLQKLHEEISKKKQRHIIWLWLDQLQYKDLDNMKFLKEFGEENILFEKCYTQNLQTSTTFKMIFSGKDVLDDKAYLIDVIDKNNSPLLKKCFDRNYDFRYIGWGKNNVYFEGISNYSLEKDNCILSLNIWKMLMDILSSGVTSIYLSHSFESHEHHYCGMMSDSMYNVWEYSFDQFVERYVECVKYIDQQLGFYIPFFNENWPVIIMSDHGQELENVYKFDENVNFGKEKYKRGRWSENSLHTVMIVKDNLLKNKRETGLFSLVNFEEIILSIMSREWKVKEREYVKIQSMPFYSSDGLKKVESVRDYKFAMLVKGIIFNGYKYLRYASGEEELYFNGNDEDNIINKYRNDDVIKKCRTLCGEIDFTIFYIPKYSAARVFLNKYKLSLLDVNGLG